MARIARSRRSLIELAKAATHRDSRATLRRSYLFNAIGRESPSVAVRVGDLVYFVPTNDQLGRQTFLTGGFDLEVMEEAVRLAQSLTGTSLDGKTFIDIGANIGTSTIPALKRFGARDAVALEPVSRNLRLLRANIAANDLEDRVRVIAGAVSDYSGTCVLEVGAENSGDCRVRLTDAPGDIGEGQWVTEEVRAATFDEIVGEVGVDMQEVGLVWIDTQGHEAHVLEGAAFLTGSRVPVVAEYWPYGLRRAAALDRLHGLLARHYRSIVDVRASMKSGEVEEIPSADAPVLASRYAEDRYWEYTDLILLK